MKAVAYSIKPFEKAFLAKANNKKHDITLISNALSLTSASYAAGKEAVIVFTNDDVSEQVINKLAALGVNYIATRSVGMDHIDADAAQHHQIKLANVPAYSPQAIAEHTVALALALSRCLKVSNQNSGKFDFRLDPLIGFNFSGKTVGLIGLGNIGQAAARIFNGLGCRVIGYDVDFPGYLVNIKSVSLDELYSTADVISLHVPLTPSTKFMINEDSISRMKKGVMLINTARGALLKTEHVLAALKNGQLGYLGSDVYEFEKNLFFEDHIKDTKKDPMLEELMALPNVIITPHQAFLTREALQQIADQTIRNLDTWEQLQDG